MNWIAPTTCPNRLCFAHRVCKWQSSLLRFSSLQPSYQGCVGIYSQFAYIRLIYRIANVDVYIFRSSVAWLVTISVAVAVAVVAQEVDEAVVVVQVVAEAVVVAAGTAVVASVVSGWPLPLE